VTARVVVVLAAARPASLGAHLAELACAELRGRGFEVALQDLLGDGFDPVLRLAPGQPHASAPRDRDDPLGARYARELRQCEGIVVVHPVWWFAPPAILKGWVDRLLVEGVALEHGPSGPPRGLWGKKQMLVVQTFNASAVVDRAVFGGASASFWKRTVGAPTGLRRVRRLALHGAESLGEAELVRFERRLVRALGSF